MADNTILNSGTGGNVIRTDEIAGVHWPVSKIAFGDDGSATMISDTASLPIKLMAQSDSTGAWDNATVSAYAASKVIKGAAGRLRSIHGYNSHTSGQFIQVHNASSLPADAAVPLDILFVPPSSSFFFDYGEDGLYCSTGIVVCNSTTGPTKTIGAANCWFLAKYK